MLLYAHDSGPVEGDIGGSVPSAELKSFWMGFSPSSSETILVW